MTYQSVEDTAFRAIVERWIREQGEILALFRFHAAAGAKSWELFDSPATFRSRLHDFEPRTSVILFRQRQLPLRGLVDDDFVAEALALVPDGVEWLIAGLEMVTMGAASWFPDCDGNSHSELESELRDEFFYGKSVAFGRYPQWLNDSDDVISAVVPDSNGRIRVGIH